MLWFDTVYLLYALPAVALALWARSQVRSLLADRSELTLTGAEAAERVARGVARVEVVAGDMADDYDPGLKVVRLSRKVTEGRSLAAVGVAAHGAGHALQQASGSSGARFRSVVVPAARVGSTVFWLLLISGVALGVMKLIAAGVWLLWLNVAAQIANLPTERDASRRALGALDDQGVGPDGLSRAVEAAAWSPLADTLTGAWASLASLAPGRSGR